MYALSKRISRKFIKVITAPADPKNLERNAGVQNLYKCPIKFSVVYIKWGARVKRLDSNVWQWNRTNVSYAMDRRQNVSREELYLLPIWQKGPFCKDMWVVQNETSANYNCGNWSKPKLAVLSFGKDSCDDKADDVHVSKAYLPMDYSRLVWN